MTASQGSWRELYSDGALWAGQSPHLLRLTPRRSDSGSCYLLGLAGGYYAEDFGGGHLHVLRDAAVIEWVGGAQGLRSIYTVHQQGELHPCLHGAAKAELSCGGFLFFGGGNPSQSWSTVSRLQVHPLLCSMKPDSAAVEELLTVAMNNGDVTGWAGVRQPDGSIMLLAPDPRKVPVSWTRLQMPAGVQEPGGRHGLHACIEPETGDFVIFGGRGDSRSPGCKNDVWALSGWKDGSTPAGPGNARWRLVATAGEAPPPKVWYGAAETSQGKWVITGGSEWQFDGAALVDQGVVWVLTLSSWTWSSVLPARGSPLPEVLVACAAIEVETDKVLVLGGCMPHKLGAVPRGQPLGYSSYGKWYAPLTRPWRFDLRTGLWEQESAVAVLDDVSDAGDTMLRSHLAVASIPAGELSAGEAPERLLVLGGSRYFSGAYFHDLLELRRRLQPEEAPVLQSQPIGSRPRRGWERLLPSASSLTSMLRRWSSSEAAEVAGSAARETSNGLPPGSEGLRGRAGRNRAMQRDGLSPQAEGAA